MCVYVLTVAGACESLASNRRGKGPGHDPRGDSGLSGGVGGVSAPSSSFSLPRRLRSQLPFFLLSVGPSAEGTLSDDQRGTLQSDDLGQ